MVLVIHILPQHEYSGDSQIDFNFIFRLSVTFLSLVDSEFHPLLFLSL